MFPINPKDQCKITLPFGYIYSGVGYGLDGKAHQGVDIAPKDRSYWPLYIVAPVEGKVDRVGLWRPPAGSEAIAKYTLEHKEGSWLSILSNSSDKGFRHLFFHLHKVFVQVGQPVKKGSVLGIMGNTGASTGRHLHYGVKDLDGECIDPKVYLT